MQQWHQNYSDKASKVGNPGSPDNAIIIQKLTYFLYVHTQSLFNKSLSRVYNTSLNNKMLEMNLKPPKTLETTYKYP
jgi:hypothetical protein